MPVTMTAIETNGSASDATSYGTSSHTPSANKLQLFSVWNEASATPGTPTVSGCNLTWVQITTVVDPSNRRRLTTFRALGSSPTNGALTINYGGTQLNCIWTWGEFGNIDTGGTNGSAAIVQSNTNSASASGGSVTLSAFSNINNATYGSTAKNALNAVTPPVGFTEIGEANVTPPNGAIESAFLATNSTSLNWVFVGSGGDQVCSMALELKYKPPSGAFLLLMV